MIPTDKEGPAASRGFDSSGLARSRRRFMMLGGIGGLILGVLAFIWQYVWVSYITPQGMWFHGLAQGFDQGLYSIMVNAILNGPTGVSFTYPFGLPDLTMPPVMFNGVLLLVSLFARFTGVPLAFECVRILGACFSGYFLAGIIWTLFGANRSFRLLALAAVGLTGGLVWVAALPWAMTRGGMDSVTTFPSAVASFAGAIWAWKSSFIQNITYPLECTYHALALAIFYFVLRGRQAVALTVGVFLLFSHPFTSAVVLATVMGWLVVQAVTQRSVGRRRQAICYLGAWALAALAMLFYYKVFLARWEPMRLANQAHLSASSDEPLPDVIALLAANAPWVVGLVWCLFTPAGWRTTLKRPAWQLIVILALVVIVLTYNQLWLGQARRVQPLHFNRGYLHATLAMLFMRMIWVCGIGTGGGRRGLSRAWVAALVVIFSFTAVDVVFWSVMPESSPDRFQDLYLKDIANEMRRRKPMQVFAWLEPSRADVYLGAVTGQVPYWVGFDSQAVPWNEARAKAFYGAVNAGSSQDLDRLGLNMIVTVRSFEPRLTGLGWHAALRSGRWVLMDPNPRESKSSPKKP